MSIYQPVSCGLHSEYELLATYKSRVKLTIVGDDGLLQTVNGKVVDVVTKNPAEYLLLVAGQETLSIRLDKIQCFEINT